MFIISLLMRIAYLHLKNISHYCDFSMYIYIINLDYQNKTIICINYVNFIEDFCILPCNFIIISQFIKNHFHHNKVFKKVLIN